MADMTGPQTLKRLKLVPVPRYVAEVSVDGVPFHLAMFDGVQDATDWAVDKNLRAMYREMAEAGRYVRMTLHVVSDDEVPGLPKMVVSMAESFETWAIGTRPENVAPLKTIADARREVKAADAPAKKPTAKKPTPKKPVTATAKAAAAKPATPKAKPTAKKPAAKPAAKKPTPRAKRK